MSAEQLRQRIAELEAAQKETEATYHRLTGALTAYREMLAQVEAQDAPPETAEPAQT